MSNDPKTIVFRDGEHLAEILKDFKGFSQFTLVTVTDAKPLVKARGKIAEKNVPFGDIFKGKIMKTAKRYASLGYEYEKSVNTRLGKEDKDKDFEAHPLPWGKWWEGSKVVLTHKDTKYIRITYLNANGKASKEIYHYEDGEEITGNDLDILKMDFLPVKSDRSRQGTDNEVIVNSIKAENIMELRVGGKRLLHRTVAAREKMSGL